MTDLLPPGRSSTISVLAPALLEEPLTNSLQPGGGSGKVSTLPLLLTPPPLVWLGSANFATKFVIAQPLIVIHGLYSMSNFSSSIKHFVSLPNDSGLCKIFRRVDLVKTSKEWD